MPKAALATLITIIVLGIGTVAIVSLFSIIAFFVAATH